MDVIVEEVLKRKNAVEGVEAQVVVELAVLLQLVLLGAGEPKEKNRWTRSSCWS